MRWPPEELWSLLAICQHHGRPARLRHDRVAAIAMRATLIEQRTPRGGERPLHLATARTAGNTNLRAQRAVPALLHPVEVKIDDRFAVEA